MTGNESKVSSATGRPTNRPQDDLPKAPGQLPASGICSPESMPGNAPAYASGARRRGPGHRELQTIAEQLSGRDWAVIHLLAEHRFLTTHHVQAFCFQDHASVASGARTARRVLARLEREQLVERLPRPVGGLTAGSAASTWRLTPIGLRLRALRDGHGAVSSVRQPTDRFVRHHLAIAETRLALVEAERRGRLVLRQLAIEPVCWRTYIRPSGSSVVLRPDLLAITSPAGQMEVEDHLFLEVDLGTESVPTVLRQCERYEDYRRSGHASNSGVMPLIVWIVPTEARRDSIARAIDRAPGLVAADYRVVTAGEFPGFIEEALT